MTVVKTADFVLIKSSGRRMHAAKLHLCFATIDLAESSFNWTPRVRN